MSNDSNRDIFIFALDSRNQVDVAGAVLFHANGELVKYNDDDLTALGMDDKFTNNIAHQTILRSKKKIRGNLDIENIIGRGLAQKGEEIYFSISIRSYANGVVDVFFCEKNHDGTRRKVLIHEKPYPRFGPIVFPSKP